MAKKTDMNKRCNKAAQKKQQKRNTKAEAARRKPIVQVVPRPGISEMGAPEGFRAIGMAQAMMEYAKPLDEYYGKEPQSIDDLNKLMKLSMLLWNHALDVEKGEERAARKSEVVKALSDAFGMSGEDAEALRVRMVARRTWLFPEDVQPAERTSPVMIMRKEILADIKSFNYDRMQHTRDEILPTDEDRALIDKIKQLDRFMEEEADYGEYEKLLTETKDEAEKRFKLWLADRGFPAEHHGLSGCLHIYFDFVYGYMHDHVVTLRTITLNYLTEFFEDFLIRKVYGDPREYVEWPPAIKLFYLFLKDKGYMESLDSITSMINAMELRLMSVLKKQFG
ncbi:MAG: hypothetical protein AABZ15_01060 [Nitrospirota bacterium]